MSQHASWVEDLLGQLTVRYGARFSALYRDIEPRAVVADWTRALAFFADKPECIAQAFEWCNPDTPPNAAQFRALAMQAVPTPALLPAPVPKRGTGVPRHMVDVLRHATTPPADGLTPNQRTLAKLRRIRDSGVNLTARQKQAIDECEAFENRGAPSAQAVGGVFKPIPVEQWPEAMRRDYMAQRAQGLGYRPPTTTTTRASQ